MASRGEGAGCGGRHIGAKYAVARGAPVGVGSYVASHTQMDYHFVVTSSPKMINLATLSESQATTAHVRGCYRSKVKSTKSHVIATYLGDVLHC